DASRAKARTTRWASQLLLPRGSVIRVFGYNDNGHRMFLDPDRSLPGIAIRRCSPTLNIRVYSVMPYPFRRSVVIPHDVHPAADLVRHGDTESRVIRDSHADHVISVGERTRVQIDRPADVGARAHRRQRGAFGRPGL